MESENKKDGGIIPYIGTDDKTSALLEPGKIYMPKSSARELYGELPGWLHDYDDSVIVEITMDSCTGVPDIKVVSDD